ncbi:MAG: DUF5681 domain-containing protein [Comamonadaceae bacterium]|nr:DUF5681 domain-containing protein [Burkholderiales bacterium]MEB2347591.1 DUF5681 domain-containing protein [Comamonadaceae bacterium]
MTTKRPPSTAWRKGQSGNPKGRPPGSGAIGKLRASIESDIPEILAALVAQAKGGDVQAARLLLERTLPAIKPQELPQVLALPNGTLSEQARAVVELLAAGEIAPAQGSQLLAALAQVARVVETDELAARVAALEGKRDANP